MTSQSAERRLLTEPSWTITIRPEKVSYLETSNMARVRAKAAVAMELTVLNTWRPDTLFVRPITYA